MWRMTHLSGDVVLDDHVADLIQQQRYGLESVDGIQEILQSL